MYNTQDHAQSGLASQRPMAEGVPTTIGVKCVRVKAVSFTGEITGHSELNQMMYM